MRFSARDLHVSPGGVEILRGISFSIASGERVTITGSNGAGKTTLMKTILGILPVTTGEVSVDGVAVGSPEWRRMRRRVGYVSQHAVQTDFPIAVKEVVAIGCSVVPLSRAERHARMREAMERTGCFHLRRAAYARLSGGEKQRVSIARCLCQNPHALILDEPTASLDPEGKETLLALTEDISRTTGITVLMVTHESGHFERSGWRRISMAEGRLMEAAS